MPLPWQTHHMPSDLPSHAPRPAPPCPVSASSIMPPAIPASATSVEHPMHAPADCPALQPDSAPSPALSFDADTAVRVLRGAGYAEHALWVADAAGQVSSKGGGGTRRVCVGA